MKYQHILLFFIFGCINMFSQSNTSDYWWSYVADYDGKPGSIVVNIGIKKNAPFKNNPIRLVTGLTYSTNRSDGLPEDKDIDFLYSVSEKRIEFLKKYLNDFLYVGSFTYQNERLDYFYIKDNKIKIEKILIDFYEKNYKGFKYYIKVEEDKSSDAYLQFLYPNKETIEFYNKLGKDKEAMKLLKNNWITS